MDTKRYKMIRSFYIGFSIYSFNGSYTDPFHYYSIWNILLFSLIQLFPNDSESFWYPLLRNTSYWTALQCSLVGFYITYIYPRSYHVFYLQPPLIIKRSSMRMMDILAHHVPFFWITTKTPSMITLSTLPTTTSFYIILIQNLPLLVYCYFLQRTYSSIGKGLNFIYHLRNYDIILLSLFYLFYSLFYSVILGIFS